MNLIAVVILNFNGRHHLETFLPSVVKYSKDANIYLVDNGSTDDSIAYVEAAFPEVTIIRLKSNHGYAGGYNLALKEVNEPYWVLLNSDVEVTEGWLIDPVERLRADDKLAAVQPKIKSYQNRDYFEYAGAAGGFMDRYGYPFCRGRIFDELEKDNGQYDSTEKVFWASGACLFIKAACFREAKGFESRFFAHMEEIDLCWRLQHLGYAIGYTPYCTVYHLGGGTLAMGSVRKIYLNVRNSHLMLWRNYSFTQWIWIFPVRSVLDDLAIVKMVFTGKFASAWGITRGVFAFWVMLFKGIGHDIPLQKKIGLPPFPGSIAMAYYLRKKKRYSDLLNSIK